MVNKTDPSAPYNIQSKQNKTTQHRPGLSGKITGCLPLLSIEVIYFILTETDGERELKTPTKVGISHTHTHTHN